MSMVRIVARAGGSATIIEAESAVVVAISGTKGTTWRDGNPAKFAALLPALFDRFLEEGTASQELACLLAALPDDMLVEAKSLLLKSRLEGLR